MIAPLGNKSQLNNKSVSWTLRRSQLKMYELCHARTSAQSQMFEHMNIENMLKP